MSPAPTQIPPPLVPILLLPRSPGAHGEGAGGGSLVGLEGGTQPARHDVRVGRLWGTDRGRGENETIGALELGKLKWG